MRIEFLKLLGRDFLSHMSIHRPPPIQKLPDNCITSIVVVSHNTSWTQEQWTSSINRHQTTEISPGSWDSHPYLCIHSLRKSSLLSSTTILSTKRLRHSVNLCLSPPASILLFPFTSPPNHFILNPSFSFSMVTGEGTVISTIQHANTRISCSFQASLYFSVAPSESLWIVHTIQE